METLSEAPSAAKAEGYYVATNMNNGVQMGYDWFAVRQVDDGLLVESRHTIFGPSPIPVQHARFEMDADWTPRRLEVKADEVASLLMEFSDDAISISTRSQQGERTMNYPFGRRRAFVLLNGGLYFPLHIVRRFNYDDPQPQQFNIVPGGICEVRRLDDFVEDGRTYRLLEMRVFVNGSDDIVRLVINGRGDLERYQTRNMNLLVKLEERGNVC
ncbi:MAG TPA: hypothetical protein VF735_21480 [Pyrinomonadaceae bacterium]|jgi:hypothetical protein